MFFILEKVLALYIIFDKEVERLPWAGELHIALSHFFSQYRIFAKCIMLLMGVKESNMIKKKVTRPKKVALRY